MIQNNIQLACRILYRVGFVEGFEKSTIGSFVDLEPRHKTLLEVLHVLVISGLLRYEVKTKSYVKTKKYVTLYEIYSAFGDMTYSSTIVSVTVDKFVELFGDGTDE